MGLEVRNGRAYGMEQLSNDDQGRGDRSYLLIRQSVIVVVVSRAE